VDQSSIATVAPHDIPNRSTRRWTASRERVLIRTLHLVLSIPILGYLYGPVAHIPPAAFFVRWIAMPLVILTGLWLWLKPRIRRWLGLVGSH
jgi:hypothetical protein